MFANCILLRLRPSSSCSWSSRADVNVLAQCMMIPRWHRGSGFVLWVLVGFVVVIERVANIGLDPIYTRCSQHLLEDSACNDFHSRTVPDMPRRVFRPILASCAVVANYRRGLRFTMSSRMRRLAVATHLALNCPLRSPPSTRPLRHLTSSPHQPPTLIRTMYLMVRSIAMHHIW